ncbi:helix-turn-helix domain-containing protein [Aquimarina sediminis]|uniref:helix-turn-helix domain-containing protein n=1 Tax=Aquimarina sediminis TaxID=2070536 RepID=UPI000CA01854|nr:AraC family transcriptional regulator [Aquimarina sediminis]
MQSFELIDLILFLGISQGIFLAITLQSIKNKNRSANKMLSIILMLSVLMLLGRMVYYRYLTPVLFQWTIFVDGIIFIFGPLCYIYFRRLSFSKNDNFRLPWYHYIPILIHLLFFLYVVSFNSEEFMTRISSGYFSIPFLCIEGAGIISNFYYMICNAMLLKAYIKEEKNTISYQQNLVSFLKLFQIAIGVFMILWAVSFISKNAFDHSMNYLGYDAVWGTISIFIFVVGYYSLKEPELFRVPFQKEKPNSQKRMSQDTISTLEKKLQCIMEEEKIFLNPNLTLRKLSERLDTSTHNISWYLNNVIQSSFYDYINHYRIKEFLRRIENNEHLQHTILAISIEVGFNSKSTFNKAFKLEMNDTPRNYIKQLEVA